MNNIFLIIKKTTFNRTNIILFLFIISSFFSRSNFNFYFFDILSNLGLQLFVSGIILFFILLVSKKLLASIFCFITCLLLVINIASSCDQCNATLVNKSQTNKNIRLMTFNTGLSEDYKNIHRSILIENPDVILFQEVSSKMHGELKNLKKDFPYDAGYNQPLEHFSSIIFSKYPLKNNKIIKNHAVVTNLIFEEKELTIIGIHLFAPLNGISTKIIYELFYKNLSKPPIDPDQFKLAKKQMEYLKNLIGNSNKDLILMGDLNMTTTSKRFTNFLKETNLYTYNSYKNLTPTWPTYVPSFLGIQIDHVLFTKNFKVLGKKVTNHFGSDHRPLIVDLVF